MRESQALHTGHLRNLHRLIEAAVSPSAPFLQFLGRVLRVVDQQVRASRQLYQPRINLLAVLDICANDEHFAISLEAETISATGMVVPLGADHGFHILDASEVLTGISDLQELKSGSHVIQLHWEIFLLHLDFENLPQIGDCLAMAERQKRDFLTGVISLSKEGKAPDVVPVKVRERYEDLVLLVANGAEVSAEISQSRACVNDGDAVRIGERDLQAGSVAGELLKTRIANGDGTPRTVKLEPHRILFRKGNSQSRRLQRNKRRQAVARSIFVSAFINSFWSSSPIPAENEFRNRAEHDRANNCNVTNPFPPGRPKR